MGFGPDDVAAIHAAAPQLAPLVPGAGGRGVRQAAQQDATWRHFLPRQHGYDGRRARPTLEHLTMDHPQIAFRKQHLGRYLANLVTKPYDGKMVEYLDMVGKIHTPKAGSKELDVPLVQMNALMGFVADALTATDPRAGPDRETEVKTLRAFGKLLWIQNDLITRHYQGTGRRRPRRTSRSFAPGFDGGGRGGSGQILGGGVGQSVAGGRRPVLGCRRTHLDGERTEPARGLRQGAEHDLPVGNRSSYAAKTRCRPGRPRTALAQFRDLARDRGPVRGAGMNRNPLPLVEQPPPFGTHQMSCPLLPVAAGGGSRSRSRAPTAPGRRTLVGRPGADLDRRDLVRLAGRRMNS